VLRTGNIAMSKIDLPPVKLKVNNECYELDMITEKTYTMLTYEHVPRRENCFLIGVIGENYNDVRLKMVGLLVKEKLI
jgi:hypothetical protein